MLLLHAGPRAVEVFRVCEAKIAHFSVFPRTFCCRGWEPPEYLLRAHRGDREAVIGKGGVEERGPVRLTNGASRRRVRQSSDIEFAHIYKFTTFLLLCLLTSVTCLYRILKWTIRATRAFIIAPRKETWKCCIIANPFPFPGPFSPSNFIYIFMPPRKTQLQSADH